MPTSATRVLQFPRLVSETTRPAPTICLVKHDIPALSLRSGDVVTIDPVTHQIVVLPDKQPGAGRLLDHLMKGDLIELPESLLPHLLMGSPLSSSGSRPAAAPPPAPAPAAAPPDSESIAPSLALVDPTPPRVRQG